MLVLSRRPQEKILLTVVGDSPTNLGSSIEILGVKGDRVRLGITAPPEIKVLREELAVAEASATPALASAQPQRSDAETRQQQHAIRNHLNFASVGLALVGRQMQSGMLDSAEATLEKLRKGLEQLTVQVDSLVARPPSAKSHQSQTQKPRTALVVEDDNNECELLAGFFRLAGYEVATVGDGNNAIDYLHDHAVPDVMLLDMMLPRCDGPTTVRMVRRDPALADLRIFAVSGYTPEQVGVDTKTAGVDRWFQKPLNPEVLLRELDAARLVPA